MGKVIGESFDPYVAGQVEIRQKKLGQTNRDNDLLTYLTSKTSWIRLASSIDVVSAEKTSELGIGSSEEGSNLAKHNILQGAVKRRTDNNSPRGGVITNYGDDPTQAYGFNSNSEFGLTPPPSVESFEITPKNEGSLTQAKIKLKCYSKQQFRIIETLYLRLGYHLLLEWGHSLYFNNEGELQTNPIYTNNPIDTFFTSDNVTDVNNAIEASREDSDGNYDALVGRVTNFNWSVNPDGHYDMDVSVTSTGDVIESLLISTPLPGKIPSEDTDEEDSQVDIDKTPLGKLLYYLRQVLLQPRLWGDIYMQEVPTNLTSFGFFSDAFGTKSAFRYKNSLTNSRVQQLLGFTDITPFDDKESDININKTTPYTENEILYINGQGWDEDYDYFYIKFGALLRIVQNFLLVYNKDVGGNQCIEPITYIDYDFGDNLAYLPSDVFSADPRVCLIPSKIIGKERPGTQRLIRRSFDPINKILGEDFLGPKESCNFMHTHLNFGFVRQCLLDSLDDENAIKLLDFIKKLCDGINSSLSNYLQLQPFHDKDTNILHIVNKANSDKIITQQPPVTRFRVGLLPKGESSFVEDVSISSTIPPNFATQIAIGAQANKVPITSDAAPFQKWNEGLQDRIFKDKGTPANTPPSSQQETQIDKFEALEKDIAKILKLYSNLEIKEELWEYGVSIKDYFKLKLNQKVNKKQATSPIIIPLSLDLTVDGISGIKIFQKYTITEDFLPDNYQNAIEFIVKGVTQSIKDGKWTTKIEGQCIPKFGA